MTCSVAISSASTFFSLVWPLWLASIWVALLYNNQLAPPLQTHAHCGSKWVNCNKRRANVIIGYLVAQWPLYYKWDVAVLLCCCVAVLLCGCMAITATTIIRIFAGTRLANSENMGGRAHNHDQPESVCVRSVIYLGQALIDSIGPASGGLDFNAHHYYSPFTSGLR